MLSVDLRHSHDNTLIRVTNVYAPCNHASKAEFLSEINGHAPGDAVPWAILGDFNLTRSPTDRNNGNFSRSEASLFNDFINDLSLIDLPLRDRLYTWSNRQSSPVLVHLDRVLVSVSWDAKYPTSTLSSFARATSDHVPLLATISSSAPKTLIFRYEKSWAFHASFRSAVVAAWASAGRADQTARLLARLRQVRLACKRWTRRTAPVAQREQDCRVLIGVLDRLEESRPLSPTENLLRSLTTDALHVSVKECVLYWKLRAKVRYAVAGDENTGFFHASASSQFRKNCIPVLSVDGVDLFSHESKACALRAYYKDLLGTTSPCTWNFSLSDLYGNSATLPNDLSNPFTSEEIRQAFLDMNRLSSPGPDGFGPSFYVSFRATIATDVEAVFHDFYSESLDLSRINRAFLVLLPKFEAARSPQDFRPISLQNCIMKAITKALCTRLQRYIHSLVDPDQTGFLPGRRISENIVYAADLLRACHVRKAPTIVFKIDFRKAFDSVNWSSLLSVLSARGFNSRWCGWIRDILSTGHTAVLLNSIPGDWILCRNGLRQGDALSPYLFILVADVLQRLIRSASSDGRLAHPIDPSLPCPVLQYADDTLILCRADP